ncbi:MAG: DUF3024 domain-containing protein [Frankiaceae bacterium]|nr:DUF3024 domain-containing protein [Frankiaceae bacterium]
MGTRRRPICGCSAGRTGTSRFRRYEDVDPTPTIDRLLAEIDTDPICIFWA